MAMGRSPLPTRQYGQALVQALRSLDCQGAGGAGRLLVANAEAALAGAGLRKQGQGTRRFV